ncbi:(deoxy)nucleoside triphosphate pyrophosphohydrolase [Calycomorphotria hydatis]|uniref:8-oxo-dGTP diphosphatase n=1 Tax=Calycomorphotria hydatis TaxID=2528027 RepID=A0A517T3N4_9PLAN|nr:(deoxy)nucleoside triphosphate pyrophosphohydrolase [Calycomorphotria hydatis]QDT62985.1 8-oxo-dGTP diphosphatase [Calycomorphotria hydatis]
MSESAEAASKPMVRIGLAVVEYDGCFLVGTRNETQSLSGHAEFPGGKLEVGESPEAATVRETREETGLSVSINEQLTCVVWDYPEVTVELNFFRCRLRDSSNGIKPTGNFRWVTCAELPTLNWPAANKTVIDLITAAQ